MIEIALCLAIIGFALVAIIGVLPFGLNVQKDNREETLIDQDAVVWMDAIRDGAQGYDDLTNYVIAITNKVQAFQVAPSATNLLTTHVYVFSLAGSTEDGVAMPVSFPLTNGFNIIGLLSRPKYEPTGNGFLSNYFVANVRAFSGSVVEKYPQTNSTILDSAFSYRMTVENDDSVPYDPNNNSPVQARLLANSHDLRLLFRWPLLPNGDAGNGRQIFRALTGGRLILTNNPALAIPNLYFFQPSTYVQAP